MTEVLVVLVAALVVIAATAVAGPRVGIAAPLVLVAIGVAAGFLPVFGSAHIEPEWILEGVLPPLLYSSAVSMPAMNFRREFGAISGLSVALVVVSALLLGVFFMLIIPGLGFAWGVDLGAIVSPTDAGHVDPQADLGLQATALSTPTSSRMPSTASTRRRSPSICVAARTTDAARAADAAGGIGDSRIPPLDVRNA